ncbi:MAG: arginase family protein [Gemmatimonadales bacterium]|nr:arginase family protein [Gemmatimonadales bacterium]
MIPHVAPATWHVAPRPGSFAAALRSDAPDGCRVALLGCPDDEGVRLNGGRVGAGRGPTALRDALARYGVQDAAALGPAAWPAVFDAGNVVAADTLAATHARVEAAADALHARGLLVIGLGGGHDLTLPLARAASRAARAADPARSVHLAYLDAHLDVRPEPGSGMAVRRLLEERAITSAAVHGLDPFVTTREQLRWFTSHGGRVDEALRPPEPGVALYLSVDLDVLDAAHAPAVSAMHPDGWTPARAAAACRAAGRQPDLVGADIMELNGALDTDGRTARLAAHLLLQLLLGIAEREADAAGAAR